MTFIDWVLENLYNINDEKSLNYFIDRLEINYNNKFDKDESLKKENFLVLRFILVSDTNFENKIKTAKKYLERRI